MVNFDVAIFMSVIGALVAMTNIITEVLKNVFWDMLPTNIMAIATAMILTLVSFFAYASYANIEILWYYIAGAIVIGFMVAYAAMFGFDKLKEIIDKMNSKK